VLSTVEKDEERASAEAAKVLAKALATGAQRSAEASSEGVPAGTSSSVDVPAGTPTSPGSVEAVFSARRNRDQAAAAIEIVEKELAAAEMALTRAGRDVERAADRWLSLSDEIDELETELARLTDLRHETGVTLNAGGRITRAMGELVRRLIADPGAA
jgi:hypothetical protein